MEIAFSMFFAEPTVRTELMEQIPQITLFLQESRPQFPRAFSEYLLPILVRYLTDPNNQVSWNFILVILHTVKVHNENFFIQVVPGLQWGYVPINPSQSDCIENQGVIY